jgi:glycosyltransferase involved in cell wall biosynthesis
MIHVIFTMANNSSVPYFNWFAEEIHRYPDVKMTFLALTNERPRMLDDMKERGSDCYWIPFNWRKRKTSMVAAVPKLYRLFRRLKPDVVHAHLFDDSVPVLLAARLAGIEMRVITKSDSAFHWYFAPKGIALDRFNNRNATHIVAISGENKNFLLEKEKADPAKVSLIHHGVPLGYINSWKEERMERLKDRFGTKGKIVIGTVARMIEWKGYRHIIEAAREVVKKRSDVVFLFTGVGDQEKELIDLIKEKGLQDHIIFTGWVEREDIPSLYRIMDIYLHAASFEPFGFVVAEAMLSGVPVVSTLTGAGADAIIHKENGYLAPHKDAAELANGIAFMLESDRKAIGEKGKARALELFDFRIMLEKHIQLYKDTLEKRT